MTTDLTIYKTDYKTENGKNYIIMEEILTSRNQNTIETLINKMYNGWFVSSGCGAEFELSGEELQPYFDYKFEPDDFYRCSVCY